MIFEARRRNVFSRHSWENSFYIQRISQLAGATVIEVLAPGPLDTIISGAREKAALAERVAFISSALSTKRTRTQQILAITPRRRFTFDLAISANFRYLRSSSRRQPAARGIPVDATFVKRFSRCGFPALLGLASGRSETAVRVKQAIGWLSESRQEPDLRSALVKTSIALENLLVRGDSEGLRGPLSERTAFLLAGDAATRRRLARAVARFYNARSEVVHGRQRKTAMISSSMLEGVDRLVLLLILTMGNNPTLWTSFEDVLSWIDDQKWGATVQRIRRPFPGSHLTRALQLTERT